MDTNSPFDVVAWSDFRSRMEWQQGEHVTLVGTTGQGKTTLTEHLLLPKRDYVMVLRTKRRDSSLDSFPNFHKAEIPQTWMKRVMVTPPWPKEAERLFAAQRTVFKRALNDAYRSGGWCIVADEVRYLTDQLKLKSLMELLWLQGRSLGVSIVASTQRPRHIPLEAYDMATHLFFWRETDKANVARVAEISGGIDTNAIMDRLPHLPQYQFLYVNTRTGEILESKVEV